MQEDWRFRKVFTRRLGEISGGVCQAVSECNGWFDFGHGSRGGMNEVLKDGLKARRGVQTNPRCAFGNSCRSEVHWAAHSTLAGKKDHTVVFAIRLLADTEYAETFMSCAVPTDRDDPPQRVLSPRRREVEGRWDSDRLVFKF